MDEYKTVERISGLYTKQDLIDYFTSLNQYLSQATFTSNRPIKFFLSADRNGKKELNLDFIPKTKEWIANGVFVTGNDIGKALADRVSGEFAVSSFLAMGVVVATDSSEYHHIQAVFEELKQDKIFQKIHTIDSTKANTQDDNKIFWINVAKRIGQPHVVSQLLSKMHWYNEYKAIAITNSFIFPLLIAATAGFIVLGLTNPLFFIGAAGFGLLTFGNVLFCWGEKTLQDAAILNDAVKNKVSNQFIYTPDYLNSVNTHTFLAKHGFKVQHQEIAKQAVTTKISLIRTQYDNDVTPVHKINLRR